MPRWVKARNGRMRIVLSKKDAKLIHSLYVDQKLSMAKVRAKLPFEIKHAVLQQFLEKKGWMRRKNIPIDDAMAEYIRHLYVDKGFNYYDVGKQTGINRERIRAFLKEKGWMQERGRSGGKGIKAKVTATINKYLNIECRSYPEYRYACYRMLAAMWSRIQLIVDPTGKRLRHSGYHVDHRFSVHDGFNTNPPVSLAVLNHPANLRVIKGEANSVKGKKSSITLKQLMKRIERFNETQGVIKWLQ